MECTQLHIEGLLVIKPDVYKDERGYFFESYNLNSFKEIGINNHFVQDNQSLSNRGVVRGLHFQKPPFAQAKLVRVIKGAVMDVAVDLRRNSSTYGQHYSIILSGENNIQFYIPEGFAHGFVAIEDNTIFSYKCSNFYHKESEGTIRFDDPLLNIDWKLDNLIVNKKDLEGQSFKDFISMF